MSGHSVELTVVGSGTAVPDAQRVGSAYFVRAGDARLLFDCGPGAAHHLARFGLPWPRLTHIALTHFHTDHIGGLPMLFFALEHGLETPRRRGLTVLGPPGTADRFQRMSAAFGGHLTDPGFPVVIREVDTGDAVDLGGGAELRARRTAHTDASLAYRVESDGSAVAYTGDTGMDEDLARFCADAGLLVTECALPDGSPVEGHMTPTTLARFASLARPDALLVTHVYPQLDRAAVPVLEQIRLAGWDGPTRRARDGLRLRIDGHPPARAGSSAAF